MYADVVRQGWHAMQQRGEVGAQHLQRQREEAPVLRIQQHAQHLNLRSILEPIQTSPARGGYSYLHVPHQLDHVSVLHRSGQAPLPCQEAICQGQTSQDSCHVHHHGCQLVGGCIEGMMFVRIGV